jgi:hypothetical protein
MLGPVAIAIVALLAPPGSSTAAPTPGEAGINTGLAPTESAVKVRGRGRFANMEFTINQTQDLTTQAVSISWTGGARTLGGPGPFAGNFVQAFQCWGDDDGTNPANPGPPPEQCQQGARTAAPSDSVDTSRFSNGQTTRRVIAESGWSVKQAYLDSGAGVEDPVTKWVYRPFRAVNGTTVNVPVDAKFNPSLQGGNYWLNPFFNIITTNEIAGSGTRENGTGSELFQVQTGLDAPGLGCGQKTQPVGDGTKKVPQCWIVIVPRGLPDDENVGATGFETPLADQAGVVTSPLMPSVWQNRIAVPIEFKPVDSPCDLAAQERRIVGSELSQAAVTSWQPTLCSTGSLPPYSFAPVGDAAARQQLASSVAGGPGMVLVSSPLSSAAVNPASPVVYAPVTASGLVIGFNIERRVFNGPPEEARLAGLRVETINLTPRLVAKLLTQSYTGQVNIQGIAPTGYTWAAKNPTNMALDKDFLRFNPEFEWLIPDSRLFGGLQLPAGNFDAATQLWEYVLADPEAKAWLDGQPDEWEMKVNPVYSTNADVNPNGAFGNPLPNSFPKADPHCYQALPQGTNAVQIVPPPLCGTDWMPYTRSFAEAAANARTGNDIARIANNPFAQAPSEVWKRDVPQAAGTRTMLALTDTVSAARFGLQVAKLTRPGDNGATRTFIAATDASLTAGIASMAARDVPGVLEPKPTADAPGAYPLTAISYAAIKPLSLDVAGRNEYAAFIEYAAGAGQEPGFDYGELPLGYAPLPQTMRDQALAAAKLVRDPASLVPAAPAAPATTVASAAVGPNNATPPSASTSGSTGAPVGTTRTNNSGTSSRPSSAVSVTDVVPSSEPATSEVPATSVPSVAEVVPATTIAGEAAPATTVPPAVTAPLDLPFSRYVVVGLGVLALLSALLALEITKRTRRADPAVASLDDPTLDGPTELTVQEQTVDA